MKYSLRDKVSKLTTRQKERAGTHHVTETKCRKSQRDRHEVLEVTPDRNNLPELDTWQKQSGRIHSLTETKWQNSLLDRHKVPINILKCIRDAKDCAVYTRRWVPWSIQMTVSAVESKCYRKCFGRCCGMHTWHRWKWELWIVHCTCEVFWKMQDMLAWNANMRVGSQVRKSKHIPRCVPCNVRTTAYVFQLAKNTENSLQVFQHRKT